MIDLQNEEPISLADAAALLPAGRNGRPVSISCIFRWISSGILGADGKSRIRLEAVRCGGRWLTTLASIERFAIAQTPKFTDDKAPIRTPGKRQTAAERAGAELEAAGIDAGADCAAIGDDRNEQLADKLP